MSTVEAVMQDSPGGIRVVEETVTLALTDSLGSAPVPPKAAMCMSRNLMYSSINPSLSKVASSLPCLDSLCLFNLAGMQG